MDSEDLNAREMGGLRLSSPDNSYPWAETKVAIKKSHGDYENPPIFCSATMVPLLLLPIQDNL